MLGKVKGTTGLRACISLNWNDKGNIPVGGENRETLQAKAKGFTSRG
jgi:hypothetical protein